MPAHTQRPADWRRRRNRSPARAAAVRASSAAAAGAKPTCACTQMDSTTSAAGSAQRSPSSDAQHNRTATRNGRTGRYGFQTSTRNPGRELAKVDQADHEAPQRREQAPVTPDQQRYPRQAHAVDEQGGHGHRHPAATGDRVGAAHQPVERRPGVEPAESGERTDARRVALAEAAQPELEQCAVHVGRVRTRRQRADEHRQHDQEHHADQQSPPAGVGVMPQTPAQPGPVNDIPGRPHADMSRCHRQAAPPVICGTQ